MSAFVCDLHDCGMYGRLQEREREPWPRCEECQQPLYDLPAEYMLTGEEKTRVLEAVRRAAKSQGRTFRWVTQEANVSGSRVSQSPKEGHKMTLGVASKLAAAVSLPLDDVLSYQPDMQESAYRGWKA